MGNTCARQNRINEYANSLFCETHNQSINNYVHQSINVHSSAVSRWQLRESRRESAPNLVVDPRLLLKFNWLINQSINPPVFASAVATIMMANGGQFRITNWYLPYMQTYKVYGRFTVRLRFKKNEETHQRFERRKLQFASLLERLWVWCEELWF